MHIRRKDLWGFVRSWNPLHQWYFHNMKMFSNSFADLHKLKRKKSSKQSISEITQAHKASLFCAGPVLDLNGSYLHHCDTESVALSLFHLRLLHNLMSKVANIAPSSVYLPTLLYWARYNQRCKLWDFWGSFVVKVRTNGFSVLYFSAGNPNWCTCAFGWRRASFPVRSQLFLFLFKFAPHPIIIRICVFFCFVKPKIIK